MSRVWEPYLPGESLIHGLDPRLKLLATFATVLVATLVPVGAWLPFIAVGILLAGIVALSRLPLRTLIARTGLALPFVLLAALSVPFAREGQSLWALHIGPLSLSLTHEGLIACAAILVRSWLAVWAATLLVATTALPALQHALWRLGLPAVLCNTIALMVRYLFVLVDEAYRLMAARAARTTGAGGSIASRAHVLGGMVGSLLIRSVARAERIHAAMLARGYDGTPRTLHHGGGAAVWRTTDTRAALLWAAGLLVALSFVLI